MKVKLLVAAIAACSSSAFAAPAINAAITETIYIGGASAQEAGIKKVMNGTSFFNGLPLYITSNNTGPQASQVSKSIAWFGYKPGSTTETRLVIYNNNNGSAGGVNQVRLNATTAESNILALSGCVTAAAVDGMTAYACSGQQARIADVALSDVYPDEFVAGVLQGSDVGVHKESSTGLQGFGVVANVNMYKALQEQNVYDGILPSSCAAAATGTLQGAGVGKTGATCEPSIPKALYASLIQGNYASAAAMLPNSSTAAAATLLTVQRRVNSSGTQSASNIYFLNNPCGAIVSEALTPAASPTTNTSGVNFVLNSSSSGVLTGAKVTTAGQLHIGVVSLEKNNSTDVGSGGFVRINGNSAIYPNGVDDSTFRRAGLINGFYDFAFETSTYWRDDNSLGAEFGAALVNVLANNDNADIPGVAQYAGSNGKNVGRAGRGGVSNCKPLSL